jgi:uncharacterized OB-fold protein
VTTQETQAAPKPVPVPDERSAGFWAAAADHVLAMQRCTACGKFAYPPVMVCLRCHSTEQGFAYEPVSGRGKVRTWTVMRQAFLPGFRGDVPYVVAEIELYDQADLRMVAQVVGAVDTDMAIGTPVEVVFDDVAPGTSVPHFTIAGRA